MINFLLCTVLPPGASKVPKLTTRKFCSQRVVQLLFMVTQSCQRVVQLFLWLPSHANALCSYILWLPSQANALCSYILWLPRNQGYQKYRLIFFSMANNPRMQNRIKIQAVNKNYFHNRENKQSIKYLENLNDVLKGNNKTTDKKARIKVLKIKKNLQVNAVNLQRLIAEHFPYRLMNHYTLPADQSCRKLSVFLW